MSLDQFIVVHFRRRKSADDYKQELDAGNKSPDLFISMGNILMTQVPDEGKYIFVNGQGYHIQNVTWSVWLPEDGEPNFSDPQAMLTLEAGLDWNNPAAPRTDFST